MTINNPTTNLHVEIENVNIKDGCLGENLNIGVFQLKSPFRDELTIVGGRGRKTIDVTDEIFSAYKRRLGKIDILFERIEKLNKNNKINIIVFPEYSLNKDIKEKIKTFVNKTEIIVIGNYYDVDDRSSKSFVALPTGWADKEIYEMKKITKSDYDQDVLEDNNGEIIQKFWWKPNIDEKDEKGYFQVLACKDFLYFTSIEGLKNNPQCIDIDHAGLIICPMSTLVIDPFEQRANSIIREVNIKSGVKSIVSILCNATDLLDQKKGIDICGKSQIVSPIDLTKHEKPIIKNGIEGLIIAEINPFTAIIKPSPITRHPNSVIRSYQNYELDREYNFENINKRIKERLGVVINPDVFRRLGLKKIYGLMTVENYYNLRETIERAPDEYKDVSIGVHTIYGFHDILIQSYEQFADSDEGKRSLELRLYPIISEARYFENEFFGHAVVKNVIKFHGIIQGTECLNVKDVRHLNIKKNILRNILKGEKVDREILKDLVDTGLCLETVYDLSDRTEEEINKNKMEYLVFVDVERIAPNPAPPEDLFKENILGDLLEDDRIRTIEEINSFGAAFVDGKFVFHVVCPLNELTDIIIQQISARSNKFGIRCKTQVIIPAEKTLSDELPVLAERSAFVHDQKEILDIMYECKKYISPYEFIHPFAINMIKEEFKYKIFDIYNYSMRVISKYYENEQHTRDMYKFIYEIADFLSKKLNFNQSSATEDERIVNRFRQNSTGFISIFIAQRIEESLRRVFTGIENSEMTKEKINELLNLSIECKTNSTGDFDCNAIGIGNTGYALRMIDGNFSDEKSENTFRNRIGKKLPKECNSEEYIKEMRSLRDSLIEWFGQETEKSMKTTATNLEEFAKVRNIFAHNLTSEEIYNARNNMLSGIYSGLKYLLYINKKFDRVDED